MLKRSLLLSTALLTLAIFPATIHAAQANPDDAVVNHFFSAVRDGNFDAATKHFSKRMKALSPAGLKGSWDQVFANQGPMLSWKIFERRSLPNDHDEVSAQLRFHHST